MGDLRELLIQVSGLEVPCNQAEYLEFFQLLILK